MLLLPLPHHLLLSQVQMETNLEWMDAHVILAVEITFVLIALVITPSQEEEEEREAVPVMTEMAEEEDAVPLLLMIKPVPLWRLGNTSTWWIPILLLN